MYCNNLKRKQKKIDKYKVRYYYYCSVLRREIEPNICNGCNNKEYKERKVTPIRKQTYKHAKAERNRYSIITKDLTKCIENKDHTGHIDKHEIFRGNNRPNSIKYGLVIGLCRNCHNNPKIEEKWEIIGQKKCMEYYNWNENDFIKIFRRNYLGIKKETSKS